MKSKYLFLNSLHSLTRLALECQILIDGGMAAQFEHTVLITDSGVEILTLINRINEKQIPFFK
jgi:methionine aminopeptidase